VHRSAVQRALERLERLAEAEPAEPPLREDRSGMIRAHA
jgi:hypothetical protein